MGVYSGGLIIGRIFSSVIGGGGLFSGELIFGRVYYQNFTVFVENKKNTSEESLSFLLFKS